MKRFLFICSFLVLFGGLLHVVFAQTSRVYYNSEGAVAQYQVSDLTDSYLGSDVSFVNGSCVLVDNVKLVCGSFVVTALNGDLSSVIDSVTSQGVSSLLKKDDVSK
jgi:hypothetical protein